MDIFIRFNQFIFVNRLVFFSHIVILSWYLELWIDLTAGCKVYVRVAADIVSFTDVANGEVLKCLFRSKVIVIRSCAREHQKYGQVDQS